MKKQLIAKSVKQYKDTINIRFWWGIYGYKSQKLKTTAIWDYYIPARWTDICNDNGLCIASQWFL